MVEELVRGLRFTLFTMAVVIGGYHLLLWGLGQAAFAGQADGSLIRGDDGAVVGSRLIAQKFSRPEYFRPRPSGVDYNAASSGGTNFGPSSPDHLAAVKQRLDEITAREGVDASAVPSEMVTASGAGMDPHIPPGAAEVQVARVAAARKVAPERVRALVAAHVEPPLIGVFGRSRVNVLELNLALDAELAGADGPSR
jgi:K+-transporting ATPase ATPase C chain